MQKIFFVLRLRSFVALGVLVNGVTTPAAAAPPEAFVAHVQTALARPEIYLSSTTPGSPLMTHDNTLVTLCDGTADILNTMVQAIRGAKNEVLLQIYEWNDENEAAHIVFNAMQERLNASIYNDMPPIRIRIIVSRTWFSENAMQQRDLLNEIKRLKNNPNAAGKASLELSSYRGSPLAILHSKVLIIDREEALVLTSNLNAHGGVANDSFNVAVALRGPSVKTFASDWMQARRLSTLDEYSSADKALMLQDNEDIDDSTPPKSIQAPLHEHLSVAVLARKSHYNYFGGGPSPQNAGIVALIDTASQHIDIVNPSLSVKELQDAIVRAIIQRKVKVRAILSLHMNRQREQRFFGGDNVDSAYKLYTKLLRLGGPEAADKLSVFWGSLDGIEAAPDRSPGNIHAKIANFDNNCLLVGSGNWNWLSFNNGREINAALIGEGVGRQFADGAFARLRQTAVALRASDLPHKKQHASNGVFTYLIERERKLR